MACLSCSCISIAMAKAVIHPPIASLTDKPSPQETQTNSKPKTATRPRKRRQRLRQQKPHPPPSIVQIERAIGAGSFRDADSSDLEEQRRKTIFDGLLPVTGGKFEGDIEKKLRETGEWIGTTTEATFRSSGKTILLVVLQWILPIWTFSLLVASGVIKLPFSTPLIDDLIM
ncbi:probable NAD(P)H dehydrogenase subunit CRR3, chloroplastic [Gossypium raimondii]|uniref:NAD(P)H dehydrogenase subunit CRR3, chloroplastic n=1 Tax=Gossypium raimondii TaxID=29730 RepID=A0A0D2R818_GOSRA|nr:probable NAD(P)H dehydrogenase subunit CRR3, chloroplastic [Gossypium raimondii]KJB15405.1 hypothetical protein B456_002G176600 [Gossypium raimondii]